jgi:flagellar motor protein MotB
MNKRQVIFVKDHKFEFSQYDPIFNLSQPKVPEIAKSLIENKKIKVSGYTDGRPCFGCKIPLTGKVKQDLCTFCVQ